MTSRIFSINHKNLFLSFLLIIFLSNLFFFKNIFAESPTISFKKTYPEKIRFNEIDHNYSEAIATPESKIVYTFEPIESMLTIKDGAYTSDEINNLTVTSVSTKGNIKFIDEYGSFLTLSIGKVKINACIEKTEICTSRIVTIYPDVRPVPSGEITLNTTYGETAYRINGENIPFDLGYTLVIGDFLDETFQKVEESSASFKIANVEQSEEKAEFPPEFQKGVTTPVGTDPRVLNGNYIEFPTYNPVYYRKTITTTVFNFIAEPYKNSPEEQKDDNNSEENQEEIPRENDQNSSEPTSNLNSSEKIPEKIGQTFEDSKIPFVPNTGHNQSPKKKVANFSPNFSYFYPLIFLIATIIIPIIKKSKEKN